MLGAKNMMNYIYVAAWSVIGGISLPNGSQLIDLLHVDRSRFVLTREPDCLLSTIDTGTAVGYLRLKGLFVQKEATDFRAALASEVEQIKSKRRKRIGSHAVLVYEASGEIDASVQDPSHELEDFIVTFDAIDKQELIRRHLPEIDSMMSAVALESKTPSKFEKLAEGLYLTNAERKIIYSINFSMSGEASVSTGMTPVGANRISERFSLLQRANEMKQVQRLFTQMADMENDRLKAFLSGWAALEILIAKLFKAYEEEFLSPLTNAGQPTLRERFLQRLKGVMKDKYRLTDKFLVVTSVLFPNASDSEVKEDYEQFSTLKNLRDKIFHGSEFSERDLPVHNLATLLRKYILANIATPNPCKFTRPLKRRLICNVICC
jgi:hypothetical protein